MQFTQTPLASLWLPAVLLLTVSGCSRNPADTWPEWQEGQVYRYSELAVEESEAVGFTPLTPERTGITIGYQLSPDDVFHNRYLMNGSGVAVGDVNGDGRIDIYVARLLQPNVLYFNLGGWRFADRTQWAGVGCPKRGSTGAVFSDVDGDSDLDLIVTAMGGPNGLFLNDGSGRFTETSDLSSTSASTTSTLADVDGDGDLDLYIANYKLFTLADRVPKQYLTWEKVTIKLPDGRFVMRPEFAEHYEIRSEGRLHFLIPLGEEDHFYRNNGGGRFERLQFADIFRDENGRTIEKPYRDWGFTAQFRDVNGDGEPDLYVCDDFDSPDRIWLNHGDGTFRSIPALGIRHTSSSSMSVDFSDINQDGNIDAFITDMMSRSHMLRKTQMGAMRPPPPTPAIGKIADRPQYMHNTLLLNRGDQTFAEIAWYSGLQASEWSWATVFMDVDLDGHEDVLITTGHMFDVQDADSNVMQKRAAAYASSFDEFKRLLLRYPRLKLHNLAFRNQGDMTFAAVPAAWGLGKEKDVSHGLATADLDNDGDLDVVINRLNSPVGVFRNDSAAPRLAIRLVGRAPNTQAIGSTITVAGGPVVQTREVIAGGRYLSGAEPLQVFAAGSRAARLRADVRWRDGTRTRVTGMVPNRLYEIRQITAEQVPEAPRNAMAQQKPMFEDVSDRLVHTHHEERFDDFSKQSLLPNRLSQLGPGLCWLDLDGDGYDDLFLTSGKGGALTRFMNNKGRAFTATVMADKLTADLTGVVGIVGGDGEIGVLTAEANLEVDDPRPSRLATRIGTQTSEWNFGADMVGPLSQADYDGDGDLDVFVGGRAVPGRYPRPATSMLYRSEAGAYLPDTENRTLLTGVGLVSGAVFSDLDSDHDPDLILALEWGPVRILENRDGVFFDVTEYKGLAGYRGWWNGVATGDFNEDGVPDIVATNWGLNSKYQAKADHPLMMYFDDFDSNGTLDVVEAHYDAAFGGLVPERGFSCMMRAMPIIEKANRTYANYASCSVADLFGDALDKAGRLQANTLATMVFLSNGAGGYDARRLPFSAQITTAIGPAVADFDGDGHEDIFLSQNFFAVQRETDRNDSGRGLVLIGDGRGGFEAMSGKESGIRVYGEQRAAGVADFDNDARVDLVVTQNAARTKLYRNQSGRPGLRVVLAGPRHNPWGIGATIRLQYADGSAGPAREVQSGSGYWTQNSPVQVLGLASETATVVVRWPDGTISERTDAAPGNTTVVLRYPR